MCSNCYACITAHFTPGPIISALKQRWSNSQLTSLHKQSCSSLLNHHSHFWCIREEIYFIWITSPKILFLYTSLWKRVPWRLWMHSIMQYNVMYLIWQAVDTVSTGAQQFVFVFCQPQLKFTLVHFFVVAFGWLRSALPNYRPTRACHMNSHGAC